MKDCSLYNVQSFIIACSFEHKFVDTSDDYKNMDFRIYGTSRYAFLDVKSFYGHFFQYGPKHGIQQMGISNIYKNTQNDLVL